MAKNKNITRFKEPQQRNDPTKKKKRWFGEDIKIHTNASPIVPNFDDQALREVMEPHVIKARRNRNEKRIEIDEILESDNHGDVPYPTLRKEQFFAFDTEAYPLHKILAEMLGTSDLSLLHTHTSQNKKELMKPLLHRSTRMTFHECYDKFVTSFCIPYLHNLAMQENIFNTSTMNNGSTSNTKITYRYQSFPCLRIVRPGEFSIGPHCDIVYGHSIGNINFHIPLTPVYGTNALYTESDPGKEDWHPLVANEVGVGYIFDGAQCLHFSLENTTETTRVSLDFRIAISVGGERQHIDDLNSNLCSPSILTDRFEEAGPGYYDEVGIDIDDTTKIVPPDSIAVKRKQGHTLLDPDKRVGFPFK